MNGSCAVLATRRSSLLLLLSLLPLLAMAESRATQSNLPHPQSVAERLDEYFEAMAAIDRFNGVVLWAEGGEPLLQRTYELNELPEVAAIGVDTPFHIASIRKLFSQWLLNDAAARGLLALDDPVSRFFPAFPRGEEITIQHLLDHRSGLPRGERFQFEARHYPLKDYLSLIESQPLEFDPGTDMRYSNFGYMMVDLILQKATGEHPATLIAQRLFQPLGMKASFEFHRPADGTDFAMGLFEEDGKLETVDSLQFAQFETGNVFSTATDLLTFVRHPSVEQLLDEDGVLAHAGGKKGYRSWLHHDAKTDRTLVILSNLTTTPIQRIIDETGAMLEGKDVDPPRRIQRQRIEVPIQTLQRYVGRYRIVANGQVLAVRLEDGSLVVYEVTDNGLADPQTLHPESENAFFTKPDSSDTIRFDSTGNASHPSMVLSIMGGYELETERLP